MVQPRRYVEPPASAGLPYGLLSALGPEIRNPGDRHWQLGATYESFCPLGSTTYDECIAVSGTGSARPAPPPAKVETTTRSVRGATSFTVFAEVDCSAPGFWNNNPGQVAERALALTEEYQVERAFWTGTAGGAAVVYPHLAASAAVTDESGTVLQTAAVTVVSGSAALDVVEGIGRLEAELAACYNQVGVIHVPRVLGPALAEANLLVREGTRYRTPGGNLVVLGSGYLGTSPAGVASDASAWVYATGGMFIYRSAVEVMPPRSTVNRANNDVRALVERTYLLGWECCHLAVNISTGGVVTGTAGAAS